MVNNKLTATWNSPLEKHQERFVTIHAIQAEMMSGSDTAKNNLILLLRGAPLL